MCRLDVKVETLGKGSVFLCFVVRVFWFSWLGLCVDWKDVVSYVLWCCFFPAVGFMC